VEGEGGGKVGGLDSTRMTSIVRIWCPCTFTTVFTRLRAYL